MADNVSVSGPVRIQSDSKERVAFDLAKLIADSEYTQGQKRSREYWLTLYAHCHRAVIYGVSNVKDILEEWQPPR